MRVRGNELFRQSIALILVVILVGTISVNSNVAFAVTAPVITTLSFTTSDNTPTIQGVAEGGSIIKLYDGTTQVGGATLPTTSAYFGAVSYMTVGNKPMSVITSDLNNDGNLDLVTANQNDNNVSILLGTGTGSFSDATNYPIGSDPVSITAGDFNNDGKIDLAAALYRDSKPLSVILGTGTGAFSAPTTYSAPGFLKFITSGDFNADGKIDLVVINGDSSIYVYLGVGTGAFETRTSFTGGSGSEAIITGDFNEDGHLDLAVAAAGSNIIQNGLVSVLLGTGTGSFGPRTTFGVGAWPTSIAIGDFNGDGHVDLAVGNISSSNISVLLGTGTGSFGPRTNFSVPNWPLSIVAHDFSGDRNVDIIATSPDSNDLSMILGTGTGSFGTPIRFDERDYPNYLAKGDFNEDGQMDVAASNQQSDNLGIVLNTSPSWSIETSVLADGIHTLSATATDAASNVSPHSNSIVVKVDTTAPVGTIAINSGDTYTNSLSVGLSLTCNDGPSGSGCAQVSTASDGVNFGPFQAYSPVIPITLTGNDGTKTVAVQFKDTVGNISPASIDTIILDRAVPTGSITINSGDQFTNDPSVVLGLTCVDSGSGCAQVSMAPDGITYGSFVSYSASAGTTLPLGDGLKTVSVIYKDGAGNVSPSATDTIILDTIAPSISSVVVTPTIVGASAELTISKTVTDSSGVSTVNAMIRGPSPSSTVVGTISLSLTSGTPQSGTWSGSFTFPSQSTAPDGTYTIVDTVSDFAGNSATISDGTITLDRTAPTITMTAVTPSLVGAASQIVITTIVSDATTGVSSITADVTGPASFLNNALGLSSGTANSGTWQTAFTFPSSQTSAPDGAYSVSVKASDAASNVAIVGAGSTTLDRTAPFLSVPSDITLEATSSAGASALYSVEITDNLDPSASASCNYPSGSVFALGETVIQCTATDNAGNQDTKSFKIIVQDTTAPTLVLPSDIILEALGPSGSVVSYGATANDAVDSSPDVSCDPASGSTFDIDTHTVHCTVTDDSGNLGIGSFSIIVQDTTPPSLSVPPDITMEASGKLTPVSVGIAVATDVVDGLVEVNSDAPESFEVGTTTITYTATDSHGNTATAIQYVTITDNTAPSVSGSSTSAEATGPDGAVVTFTVTATDIVDGDLEPDCNYESSSIFNLGETIVTCTATDSSGNTGSSSFTITVDDKTPPSITTTETNAIATGPETPVVFEVSATDLVDLEVEVICDPASGSGFLVGTTSVECSATDSRGNTAYKTFNVIVTHEGAPSITTTDYIVEATSPNGAEIDFSVSATDIVDGDVPVSCDSESPSTYPLGITIVTCTAENSAGHSTTTTFSIDVVDTTEPTISVSDVSAEATGPDGANVQFIISASDVADASVEAVCDYQSGDLFPIDVTLVTCTATDSSGNSASATFVVTVHDHTPPSVSTPGDFFAEADSKDGAIVSFGVSAFDLVDGDLLPVTCDYASGTNFDYGDTLITCSATDTQGNTGSSSFTVTVDDTTAPLVTVPADHTLEATSSQGAQFSYSASAFDTVDGSLPVECSHASGDIFGIGTITVVCLATDSHGNTGTNSFTIVVQDTIAPTITATDVAVDAVVAPIPVSFTVTATDLVDGNVPLSCDHASGSSFPLGTTLVKCTAEDSHGNTAESSFNVIVNDVRAPPSITSSDIVAEATGPTGAAVSFTVTATDYIDGSVPVSCDHTSGASYPIGTTTVVCTATNSGGKTATSSFTIQVQDTVPPVITVPPDITSLPTSKNGASVTFTVTASDIVDGTVSVTCNPASGSTFVFDTTTVTCSATDSHGNTGTASFHVTVLTPLQSIQSLMALKDSFNLDKGMSTSLGAKLNAAYQSLNSGNLSDAKSQLNAFINELDAQSGKKLTTAQANELKALAQIIINAIG